MVSAPFDLRVKDMHKQVKYSVGNPMGAYSSWSSFALSHHYVMYHLCTELGMD